MYWKDEGFLLSKNNFDENSLIIETLTKDHGKYTGIVYGGSSRKLKKIFQVGNKIMLNFKSKSENKTGYFSVELIKAISPLFFEDKRKTTSILSASSLLKILLPERQINKKIYLSYEKLLNEMFDKNWIIKYICWEFMLIKDLGYEINFDENNFVKLNNKTFKIPEIFKKNVKSETSLINIKEGLSFNKNLLIEYFIIPNRLNFPNFRNILEKYY